MASSSDTENLDNILEIVIQLAKNNSSIQELEYIRKLKQEGLSVKRIGSHGYMNDIYLISGPAFEGRNEVVLKKAFPYMKRMGPSHPTPQGRNLQEYNALCKMAAICPANIVTPYCHSVEQKAFLMESLTRYENLKTRLIEGKVDKVSIDYLARALAAIHGNTNIESLGEAAFTDLKKEFDNQQMCDIMGNYIFSKTFDSNDKDNLVKPELQSKVQMLYQDAMLLQEVAHIHTIYHQKKECLIHGDLHTGSVMVPLDKEEDHPKLFDLEFACVGPPAFDVGFILAHFFMAYYQHELTEENNDLHRQVMYKIQEVSGKFLDIYFEHRGQLSEEYKSEFIKEVAGFAACEIFFRVIGCGSSENIGHSASMEEAALECGLRLMRQRQRMNSPGKLLFLGLQLC